MIPYVLLTFGKLSTPIISKAGRWGDISYGLYLYAFPIQQLLVYKFPTISLTTEIAVTFLITIPFAALSWHLIEKNALKLKSGAFSLRRQATA
ncbi:hypothetical protein [Burkholderia sp. Ac-20353]|uniref:acyltransferase family protein n=1 Tax=Burkholderia sp. Ac-20353 TaxID=2703894 RepID=UPI00197B5CE0|nr:hypothetical protein [Burkholderia sp. Ac-20353]MBN3791656.1 hypothetical protein [Burkholderia sp. Ac-20353]